MKIEYIKDLNQIKQNPLEVRFLDLSGQGLTQVPPEVWQCSNLIVLRLEHNKLASLPDEFCNLKRLQVLDLRYNEFTGVPQCIYSMRLLQEFALNHNKISYLSSRIADLPNLEALYLSHNELYHLPHDLYLSKRLRKLDVSHNKLTLLPDNLDELRLDSINVSHNCYGKQEMEHWQKFSVSKQKIIESQNPAVVYSFAELKELSRQKKQKSIYNIFILESEDDEEKLPEELAEYTELRCLILHKRILSEENVKLILSFKKMQVLSLKNCSIEKLPAEIGSLKDLRILELSENKLITLPAELGNLSLLESLDLDYNRLEALPEELSKLTNLRCLSVANNTLKKLPDNLGQIHKLTKLNAANNQIQNFPKELDNLQDCELDFTNNPIKYLETVRLARQLDRSFYPYLQGPYKGCSPKKYDFPGALIEGLQNPEEVVYLDLSEQKLKEIPPEITQLPNLFHLDLSSNQIEEIPEFISKLKNLNTLILSDNPVKNFGGFSTKLENLKELYLGEMNLTALPGELFNQTTLRYLNLSQNNISEIPPAISRLNNLEDLELENNKLGQNEAAAEKLGENLSSLKKLRILLLDNNNIKKWPPALEKIKKLEVLSINKNPVKEIPEEFLSLRHLKEFTASSCSLSTFPDNAKKIFHLLHTLSLSNNALSEVPGLIPRLRKLKVLDLSNCPIAEESVQQIQQAFPDTEINFSNSTNNTQKPEELSANFGSAQPAGTDTMTPELTQSLNPERSRRVDNSQPTEAEPLSENEEDAMLAGDSIPGGELTEAEPLSENEIDAMLAADSIPGGEPEETLPIYEYNTKFKKIGDIKNYFHYIEEKYSYDYTEMPREFFFCYEINDEVAASLSSILEETGDAEFLWIAFSENLSYEEIENFILNVPIVENLYLAKEKGFFSFEKADFISSMPSLKRLDISNTEIKDLTFLKNTEGLLEFSYSLTKANDTMSMEEIEKTESFDVSLLSGNSNLKYINLWGRALVNCEAFKSFNPEYIDLTKCTLNNIDFLESYTNIYHLDLDRNTAITNLNPIKNLTNLEALNLSEIKIEDSSFLQNLNKLSWLSVKKTGITNFEFLHNMPDLYNLNIAYTNINSLQDVPLPDTLGVINISALNLISIKELLKLNSLKTIFLDDYPGESLPEGLEDFLRSEKEYTIFMRNHKLGDSVENLLKQYPNSFCKIFHSSVKEESSSKSFSKNETKDFLGAISSSPNDNEAEAFSQDEVDALLAGDNLPGGESEEAEPLSDNEVDALLASDTIPGVEEEELSDGFGSAQPTETDTINPERSRRENTSQPTEVEPLSENEIDTLLAGDSIPGGESDEAEPLSENEVDTLLAGDSIPGGESDEAEPLSENEVDALLAGDSIPGGEE